jgi:hypothetical protein
MMIRSAILFKIHPCFTQSLPVGCCDSISSMEARFLGRARDLRNKNVLLIIGWASALARTPDFEDRDIGVFFIVMTNLTRGRNELWVFSVSG